MKHILSKACGIDEYMCVGISTLLLLNTLKISKHSINYDNLPVPATGNVLDAIANNFYNVPLLIEGVINYTLYNDLQNIGAPINLVVGRCRSSYDPFQSDSAGLLDYFGTLTTNASTNIFRPYPDSLSLYGHDLTGKAVMLVPGILLPQATLSLFNPTPIITLPSWIGVITNNVINTPAVSGSQRIAKAAIGSNQSPCLSGFLIYAVLSTKASAVPQNYLQVKRKGSVTVLVSVSLGLIDISGNLVSVPASQLLIFTLLSSDITNLIDSILVYVNIEYNFLSGLYLYKEHLFVTDSLLVPHASKFSVWVYIGSISVYCQSLALLRKLCALNVTQPQCSPIMIQDSVMADGLPQLDDDATVYVYAYNSKSTQMGWMPVKDC